MILSRKQRELSLRLFGSDRLTRRQFNRAMDELKEASKQAFEEANEADLLALVSSTTLRKESARYHVGPCPMSGCASSDDGFFVDTLHNIGGCRKCNWQKDGHGAGPVGFIAALYHLSAYDARDHILGREISVTLPKVEFKKRLPKTKAERVRQDFSEFVNVARANLAKTSRLADWARRYFARRGINERTLAHFGVGVIVEWDKPFAVMPFFSNTDLCLCAVRLRQEHPKKPKISKTGSIFSDSSFGLDVIAGHEVGAIVEGEVNALSVWQALDSLGVSADVLSVGSENAFKYSSSLLVTKHLKQAKTLIVWADKASRGQEVRQIVARIRPCMNVIVLHSKERRDKKGKIDANDLLLMGKLSKLMALALPKKEQKEEQSETAREELLHLCGLIAEDIGTDEADQMYRQAEDIYLYDAVSALFAHYEQMKALRRPSAQATFDLGEVSQQQDPIYWD